MRTLLSLPHNTPRSFPPSHFLPPSPLPLPSSPPHLPFDHSFLPPSFVLPPCLTSYLACASHGKQLHFGPTLSQPVLPPLPPSGPCLPVRLPPFSPFLFLALFPHCPPTCASRRIYCGESLFVAPSGSCASSALHCSVPPLARASRGQICSTLVSMSLSQIMPRNNCNGNHSNLQIKWRE